MLPLISYPIIHLAFSMHRRRSSPSCPEFGKGQMILAKMGILLRYLSKGFHQCAALKLVLSVSLGKKIVQALFVGSYQQHQQKELARLTAQGAVPFTE